jgi:formylglycine-generating enzyme required for sulfatase activity
MLLKLLETLRNAKLDLTPVEVAEALLLARFLPGLDSAVETPAPAAPPPATKTDEQPPTELKPEQPEQSPKQATRPPLQPGDAVLPQPTTKGPGTVAAVPFRSPQARALPAANKIGSALRPLRRRHFSAQRVVMDVEATVQQIADGGPKTIVWQPARERWLAVELVLDESLSMHIWRPTLREWRRLLERHGAFREVRVWQLKTDDEQAQLGRETATHHRAAQPGQLLAPTGRQLVMIVSDCTAKAWYHGSAYQMLIDWARHTPTVLTQVLPRSLWLGTSMPEADATMQADQPGLPNARLHVQPDWYAEWLKTGAPLPIVTLDEWSIAPWARMVAGSGSGLASGLVVPDMTEAIAQGEPLLPPTRPAPADAAARVQNFMGTASPLARQLAGYLAVAPLSLPVLQLVQQAMLPQSRQSHLAEIFRSYLVNLPAPTPATLLTEETIFDFHDGVRDELLHDLTRRETLFVLDKVADFIRERSGQGRGFEALLALPNGQSLPPDTVQVDPLALAFARIGARTLRTIGVRLEQAEQWESFVSSYDQPPEAQPDEPDEPVSPPALRRLILAYASPDAERALALRERLQSAGFAPMMDVDLPLGSSIADSIQQAIAQADYFLLLLSRQTGAPTGYLQTEIQQALEIAQRRPFLIPVRLEDCALPPPIGLYQAFDLFDEQAWEALVELLSKEPQELDPLFAKVAPADESFTFTTVTLDQRGKEIGREQLQARQFVEALAPDIQLEMVEIPGSTFLMGAPKSEAQSYDSERPQHKVTISPFFMGKFTITQEQWRVIAADESLKVKIDLQPEPANFKGKKDSAQRPVEQVSWEDATEFCARLAKKTGRAYRLPTEAEWEYACRAGTTTPFAFGATITPDIVNYDGNYPYADAPKGQYRQETIPVGSLGVANAFGVFDMHGNVWEWCQDWYGEYTNKEQTDPTGPPTGEYRLLRGGSWDNYSRSCRAAFRNNLVARNFLANVGFRVVVGARTP